MISFCAVWQKSEHSVFPVRFISVYSPWWYESKILFVTKPIFSFDSLFSANIRCKKKKKRQMQKTQKSFYNHLKSLLLRWILTSISFFPLLFNIQTVSRRSWAQSVRRTKKQQPFPFEVAEAQFLCNLLQNQVNVKWKVTRRCTIGSVYWFCVRSHSFWVHYLHLMLFKDFRINWIHCMECGAIIENGIFYSLISKDFFLKKNHFRLVLSRICSA